MSSFIVVEGCDGSGKSTLLDNARLQIPKRYFVLVRHSCRPLQLSDALQFMRATRHAVDIGLDLIADRHPLISEPIYGPLLRGSHLFDGHFTYSDEDHRLEYLHSNIDRVIYCRPPEKTIEENLDRLPQLSGVRATIWDLLDRYDSVMGRIALRGVPVVSYDYTTYQGTLEDLFFGEVA